MKISLVFTDGDAKMEMRVSGKKLTIRRPSKKSKTLDLLAKGLLDEKLCGAEDAAKAQGFLAQGSSLRVALGEERCG